MYTVCEFYTLLIKYFQVFPFCIVFNSNLMIKHVGKSMAAFIKGDNFTDTYLHEKFHIRRPLIQCLWVKVRVFRYISYCIENCFYLF